MQECYQTTYLSAAGDNQVITTKPCFLHKILIGKDVSNGVIELADNDSDGDNSANLIDIIEGDTLMTSNGGVKEYNRECKNGLTLDLALQTNICVVWSPLNVYSGLRGAAS